MGLIALNVLRTRRTQREEPLAARPAVPALGPGDGADPQEKTLPADSVGVAPLVVLDALTPAERPAFVLYDLFLFPVPFDAIAPLIERTPAITRQPAGRARRHVRGAAPTATPGPKRQRTVVEAFLAATRDGDFDALVALLHPDVVLTADRFAVPTGEPAVVDGSHTVAEAAQAAMGRARFTGSALLDCRVGPAMAPGDASSSSSPSPRAPSPRSTSSRTPSDSTRSRSRPSTREHGGGAADQARGRHAGATGAAAAAPGGRVRRLVPWWLVRPVKERERAARIRVGRQPMRTALTSRGPPPTSSTGARSGCRRGRTRW